MSALSKADVAAVRACWDAMQKANRALDLDGVEACLTQDYVQLDPRAEPIHGRQAFRSWAESLDMGTQEGGFHIEEVDGSGDVAYAVWTFDLKWTEGGEPVEATGKGMSIFRKQGDGSWLMSRGIWNPNP